ncbi:conserved hypothetical protein [Acidimicrobium ferrooxidans DSM 10331]|uniref:Dimethyladenosine transferase n=1 Tax=Acidimicrobium ferrooxidans (strain DSM 10331 / JCM 15462 / NBRC 103882 / ICP) TaxID=525909 RepID=C7LY16_ACIFD|nr:SRPBCC family protein [Acidimicrobium ferrooxidans]ACU53624.1 conserved hypothetical protein [Acidimicrobium ferrooxidans DSM 10331]
MAGRIVTAELTIAAPADTIFDVLARPALHPVLDGSGTVRGVLTGPERLSLGARFGMRMRLVVPYVMWNRVVAFDEGREIAWAHLGRHIWRYRLTPEGEQLTRVVESFEWDDAPLRLVYEMTGVPERNALAMRLSLARLEALVTGERRAEGGQSA